MSRRLIKVTDSEREARDRLCSSKIRLDQDVIRCTSCFKDQKHEIFSEGKLFEHVALGVIVCSDCFVFYGDGEFSTDEDGVDKYCRWCGQGGILYLCSKCPGAFCKKCLTQNLSKLAIGLDKKKWLCLFCDPRPLYRLRAQCWAVQEHLIKEMETPSQNSRNFDFLSDMKLDNSCRSRLETYFGNMRRTLEKTVQICMGDLEDKLDEISLIERPEDVAEIVSRVHSILSTASRNILGSRQDLVKYMKSLTEESCCVKSEQSLPTLRLYPYYETPSRDKRPKIPEPAVDAKSFIFRSKDIILNRTSNSRRKRSPSLVSVTSNHDSDRDVPNNKSIRNKLNKPQSPKSLSEVSSYESSSSELSKHKSTAHSRSPASDESNSISSSDESPSASSVNSDKASDNELSQKTDFTASSAKSIGSSTISGDNSGLDLLKKSRKTGGKVRRSARRKSTLSSSSCENIDLSDSEEDLEKILNLKSLLPSYREVGETKDWSRAKKKSRIDSEGEALDDFLTEDSDGGDLISPDVNMKNNFSHLYEAPPIDETTIANAILCADLSEISDRESVDFSSEGSTKKKKKLTKTKSKNESKLKPYTDSVLQQKIDSSDDEYENYLKSKERKVPTNEMLSSSESSVELTVTPRKKEKRKKFNFSDSSPIESDESSQIISRPLKRKSCVLFSEETSSNESDCVEIPVKTSKKDSPTVGRKNIQRVRAQDELEQSTQEALKEEQERKKRIIEKQKLFNETMLETAKNKAKIKELILDFDPVKKKPILSVHPRLVELLKPHQAEGVKFMWDACFESVDKIRKEKGSGCILAHCMGLGKTLQVVTLLHTLLTHPETRVKTALVVCPLTTAINWDREFEKWTNFVKPSRINIFNISKTKASHRAHQLKDWRESGGVLIISYNLARTLISASKNPPKDREIFKTTLVDPGPDVVICDEGHLLKNESTALSMCMCQMKTRRRIILTGTPLQNNLLEYHCMVQFVKPNLLGTRREFKNRFVNPIQNGQFEDSTPHDVRLMKRRAHVLHSMLDGIVQRKDYNVLAPFLPPKYEYVIHLKPSEAQCVLYRQYLTSIPSRDKRNLFADFHNLSRICSHPRAVLMKSDSQKKEDDQKKETKNAKASKSKEPIEIFTDSEEEGKPNEISSNVPENWFNGLINEDVTESIFSSSKLFMAFSILRSCEERRDKVLLFSQSLYTLDVIEHFLQKITKATESGVDDPRCAGFTGIWIKNLDYFRLDGGVATEIRDSEVVRFNNSTRSRLFLVSTRAGCLGINLTGANRVILYDASWNPSSDVQSLFRVYRFGQVKPVYIYRFLSKGTMEEKIYERQVAKLSISLRVVDEHQIERHFTHSVLSELYQFNPENSSLQSTPALPKDRVMANILQMHKEIIMSYHQHDSLLVNIEDQVLTEEERKAAWAEFEDEKKQGLQPTQNFAHNIASTSLGSNVDGTTTPTGPFGIKSFGRPKVAVLNGTNLESAVETSKTQSPILRQEPIRKETVVVTPGHPTQTNSSITPNTRPLIIPSRKSNTPNKRLIMISQVAGGKNRPSSTRANPPLPQFIPKTRVSSGAGGQGPNIFPQKDLPAPKSQTTVPELILID